MVPTPFFFSKSLLLEGRASFFWGEAQKGPLPIHDVVVSAVAAAVMAATITFNSTSQNLELFIRINQSYYVCNMKNYH